MKSSIFTRVAVLSFATLALLSTGAAGVTPESAPRWKLKDLDGHVVTSESLAGKVVVIDFWATWCPPCREEIPGYIKMQKEHGDAGLVIVGISLDAKGPGAVKAFAEKNGINYTVVMGDESVADAFGGVEAIPTTFVIGRDGRIAYKKVGYEAHDEFEKRVVPLL